MRALLPALLLFACASLDLPPEPGGGGAGGDAGAGGVADGGQGGVAGEGGSGGEPIGGDRPVTVRVPDDYSADTPVPLVILLHGYSSNGAQQDQYFGLSREALARGWLFAAPDGTVDNTGNRYWNATNACCAFFGAEVDDVAYLRGVIDDVKARYAVDSRRVYLVGHSNGGFMSHRMACDASDVVTAIVSLAGATFADPERCAPTQPVAVAQVHGTADETILYDGGSLGPNAYPGAVNTVTSWAALGGCTGVEVGDPLDLDRTIQGAETTVERRTGCGAGWAAELWSIQAGRHVPALNANFAPAVLDFLEEKVKP